MASKGVDFLIRSVREKHRTAIAMAEQLLTIFLATAEQNARKKAAKDLFDAATALNDMLIEEFRATWLHEIRSISELAAREPTSSNTNDAIRRMSLDVIPPMRLHKWVLDQDDEFDGIDFDKIFSEARDANRIPELFEEICSCLQQIIDSGLVDSIRVVQELRIIISTLQRAKKGSGTAVYRSYSFTKSLIKNIAWESMGDIPLLGGLVRGLKKTLEDTEQSLDKVDQQVIARTTELHQQKIPKLVLKQPLALEYIPEESMPDGESAS